MKKTDYMKKLEASQKKKARVVREYNRGLSVPLIASNCRITVRRVYQILEAEGVPRNRQAESA